MSRVRALLCTGTCVLRALCGCLWFKCRRGLVRTSGRRRFSVTLALGPWPVLTELPHDRLSRASRPQVRADFGRRSVPSYAGQDADAAMVAAAAARRGGLPLAAAPGLITLRSRADSGTRSMLPVNGGGAMEALSLGNGAGGIGPGRLTPVMMWGRGGGDPFQRRSDPIDVDRDADAWDQGVLPPAAGRQRAATGIAVPRAASTGAAGNPSLMLRRDLNVESGLEAIAAAAAAVAAAEDRGVAADHAAVAGARPQRQLQLRALQQQQQQQQQQQAQLTSALRELQEQQQVAERQQQHQAEARHHWPMYRGLDDEADADCAAAMLTKERAPHAMPADAEAEERVAGLRSTLLLLLQQRRAAEGVGAGAGGGERGGSRVGDSQGGSLALLRTGAEAGGTR